MVAAPTAAPGATTAHASAPPPFVPRTTTVARDDSSLRRAQQTALRREILDAAWKTVRDKHYDKTLGGIDWNAVRARYEVRAVDAPDERTFYRVANEMLGELGQSHLRLTGPGDGDETTEANDGATAAAFGPPGDAGLIVRLIDGRPTVARVRAGSFAERAGLRPGFRITHIGGRPLAATPPSARPLRPVEERFYLRLAAARLLAGPAQSQVSVRYEDAEGRPHQVLLTREPYPGQPVTIGLLPPLYPEVTVRNLGDVGYVAFNFFLLEPVLAQVQRAIDDFRERHLRALIIDLRGNPGGMGAMAIPVAARLVDKPLTLGSMTFRDFSNTLTAAPSLGVKPFLGAVVIVTDEGTASTSEMLAAGLQEAKRAVVVGDSTLGAVLPSAIEQLPGGAVLQYIVADFRTPSGVLIEGRGVQPNRRIVETQTGLLTGRDVVLDAALVAARASAR